MFGLVELLRIGGFSMHFFSDQLFRDLGKIGRERGAQLAKLWPEDLIDKTLRRFDDNGLPVHSW